jgi:xanthine/uracil/vitamin C permease (AzgA family)
MELAKGILMVIACCISGGVVLGVFTWTIISIATGKNERNNDSIND